MVPRIEVFDIFAPSDYTISTWLLFGATLQCLLVSILPQKVALLPAIFMLLYRFTRGYLIASGQLPNPRTNLNYFRTTTEIPSSDDSAMQKPRDSLVVLVLAAHWSHPNGRFSPGSQKLGRYFTGMWADAEQNRDIYGFLGNTPSMVVERDNSGAFGTRNGDDEGLTTVYLSYWKTLEGLHRFACADAHMNGWKWWDGGARQEFKHMGVMHEVFEVKEKAWENVYHNFMPFGLGNARFPVNVNGEKNTDKTKAEWVSGLTKAKGNSMYKRMGHLPGK